MDFLARRNSHRRELPPLPRPNSRPRKLPPPLPPPSPPPTPRTGPYEPSDGRILASGPVTTYVGQPVPFPIVIGVDAAAAAPGGPLSPTKNLVFRLAVHGPGRDGPRLEDQAELISWPPTRHSVAAAEASSHGDARLQVVCSRTRARGRVTRHASYYFHVGGFKMTAEPGTYRLAVEVREPDDVVGVVPPRASYRAVHDVVVLPAPAEGDEDSAGEAELLLEGYNPTELKFYETLQRCEAERLSRRKN